MPRSIISAPGGIHHEKLDATGSGPAEAMASFKRVPCCTMLALPPALTNTPRGCPSFVPRARIHALDPSLHSSKVWPVTLGWHQMVKGSWPSSPSTRITYCLQECPLRHQPLALPTASTPSRHDTHPRCVVDVLFWTVAVPSWHSGPMLRNATDALFHVLHPAAITLTAAHTRPPSPRPTAATCEHEQLSVMARQRPPAPHARSQKLPKEA